MDALTAHLTARMIAIYVDLQGQRGDLRGHRWVATGEKLMNEALNRARLLDQPAEILDFVRLGFREQSVIAMPDGSNINTLRRN